MALRYVWLKVKMPMPVLFRDIIESVDDLFHGDKAETPRSCLSGGAVLWIPWLLIIEGKFMGASCAYLFPYNHYACRFGRNWDGSKVFLPEM
jgi:hypothetical protein